MIVDFETKKELQLFKIMYRHLFNSVTHIIELCTDPVVKNLLIIAQQETEEIYINEDVT